MGGYVESSMAYSPTNSQGYDWLDFLSGTWTVPSNPANVFGLIYLFDAVTPADGSTIMQPVLQYGFGPAGGGSYWTMSNWYVSDNASINSALNRSERRQS